MQIVQLYGDVHLTQRQIHRRFFKAADISVYIVAVIFEEGRNRPI